MLLTNSSASTATRGQLSLMVSPPTAIFKLLSTQGPGIQSDVNEVVGQPRLRLALSPSTSLHFVVMMSRQFAGPD